MDKKKILIVDDEPDIVKFLGLRLQSQGYEVIGASDGRSCLKKAAEEFPDLILLDIIMSGLNGFEVCKLLKENEKTKDIPVIMLTALAQEKDLTKGLESGAFCFITKPHNQIDLFCEIKNALNKK